MTEAWNTDAGAGSPRRLFVYNGGFLRPRLRRILSLAGWQVTTGLPRSGDFVGVWGQSPTAHRGEALARRCDVPLVRIEDAFLRSLFPGRDGEPPLGLLVDRTGVHFDAAQPSDLETLLARHPLDDTALLNTARTVIERLCADHLTKYAATRLDLPLPEPGYVLVIDQTAGDASVRCSNADRTRFLEMLTCARLEHPGARVVIKTHPETAQGHRPGHFRPEDCASGITLFDAPVSPWQLLDGAIAVYTVSSGMGFEAILAGHRPRVYGTPFYAGWGLTEDEIPLPRRTRRLSRAQLSAGALLLYPKWYDPYRDRLCAAPDAVNTLSAEARAWREDHQGWTASGMRLWKRAPLQAFYGQHRRVRFAETAQEGRRHMAWAGKADAPVQIEDGFLRSKGLGAALTPPLSLVADDEGIYFDPTRPSRLERLIAASAALRPDQRDRAERLRAQICTLSLSKYNLSGALPKLPDGPLLLVPGQVEDDASIRLGSPEIQSNLELLRRARAANPNAVILYKPHPDVEAGLRPGAVETAAHFADLVLTEVPIAALYDRITALWTLTSTAGFEALMRGVQVTTLGVPFYAGWGLTHDRGPVPARRLLGPRPDLAGLIHASLIDYPRYLDPVTRRPCPPEVILDRLASGTPFAGGSTLRLLAKAQGVLASRAHWWR